MNDVNVLGGIGGKKKLTFFSFSYYFYISWTCTLFSKLILLLFSRNKWSAYVCSTIPAERWFRPSPQSPGDTELSQHEDPNPARAL